MRVFVTGASGWIGSAVVPELTGAGHQVVGLARSRASADALAAAGAEVRRGSLEELDALREGAAKSDAVIHLAFIHDFDRYEDANETDRQAIAAMGAALEGSSRPFAIASGVTTNVQGRPATEDDPPDPGFPRSQATVMALALERDGVRPAVVRLPPTTHGRGDNGFISMLVGIARDKGVAGYVGDGANVWPAVHRSDAARVFRLAIEHPQAGCVWHAIGEEGVPTRTIAEVIGRHLEVPVASFAAEDAVEHFGWLATIWALDLPTSNAITRQRLEWQPSGPGLLQDLEDGHYFRPV